MGGTPVKRLADQAVSQRREQFGGGTASNVGDGEFYMNEYSVSKRKAKSPALKAVHFKTPTPEP
jgi:hypothetical protein